jgi:hypothetical protein
MHSRIGSVKTLDLNISNKPWFLFFPEDQVEGVSS